MKNYKELKTPTKLKIGSLVRLPNTLPNTWVYEMSNLLNLEVKVTEIYESSNRIYFYFKHPEGRRWKVREEHVKILNKKRKMWRKI